MKTGEHVQEASRVHHVEESEDLADPAPHDGQRGAHGRRVAGALQLEKRERDGGQHDVVVPAAKAPAFKMIQPEVVFEFAVLLLDRPTAAGESDEVPESGRRREVEQIVFPDVVERSFTEQPALAAPCRCAHPHRSEGGHRMYDPAQREKLQLIMDLREAGLSIHDIKDLFALKSRCGSANEASTRMTATLECRIGEMQRKIVVLRRLRDELSSMVSVVRECGSCEHKEEFIKRCGECDVMEREDLPRAMRLLWGR